MISKMPMMMNQMASRTARKVREEAGVAATTIPAIRLITPNAIHQARPSLASLETPPMSAASP